MPSRLWYAASAAIVLIGIALGVAFLWPRLAGLGDDFVRVVVPGAHEIELPEPGSYTIFHEPTGTIDGVLYSASDVSGLRVALSTAGGDEIALDPAAVSSRYSFGGRTGFSVFGFEIAEAGTYRLSASYDDGRTEPSTILAISSGFVGKLVTTILGFMAILLGSILLAVGIGITTFVRRRRYRRAT
jgi:hypothetical protein